VAKDDKALKELMKKISASMIEREGSVMEPYSEDSEVKIELTIYKDGEIQEVVEGESIISVMGLEDDVSAVVIGGALSAYDITMMVTTLIAKIHGDIIPMFEGIDKEDSH